MLMRLTGNPVLGIDLNENCMQRFEHDGGQRSTLKEMMSECQIVVATTGVPNLIPPDMVRKGQIILALSNPDPEIEPALAIAAGAAVAADGKSINNVLAFPGLFAGALRAEAKDFSDAMLIAAARTIAQSAPEGQLVPDALNNSLHEAVANAVAAAVTGSAFVERRKPQLPGG
jgi:malate dehydrogenase (oxaloacetate-decarboxylating)